MITIRRAQLKDIDQIIELTNLVADKHAQNRSDIFLPHPYHITKNKLKKNILDYEKHIPLVAEKENKIIGVMLCSIKDIINDNKFCESKIISIEDTCVNKNYRRNKIGSKMIENVKSQAQKLKCSRIETNVWKFNNESYQFFNSNGFSEQRIGLEYILSD